MGRRKWSIRTVTATDPSAPTGDLFRVSIFAIYQQCPLLANGEREVPATADEILARLLELNRQRALEETVPGEGQTCSGRAKPSRGKSRKGKTSVEPSLVPDLLSEEKQ